MQNTKRLKFITGSSDLFTIRLLYESRPHPYGRRPAFCATVLNASVDHLHQTLGDRALLRQRENDDIDRQLQLPRRVTAVDVVLPTQPPIVGF